MCALLYSTVHPLHDDICVLTQQSSGDAMRRLSRLATDMERAQREGWCFGAKLVRGAYMFMERDRAKQCGYPSPVHDSIEATHANYNECALASRNAPHAA